MLSTPSIGVSREILHATWMTPQERRRAWAIHLFQQGRLSFGNARERTSMTVWAFQQILASREIPVHHDIEEYEEDLATLGLKSTMIPDEFP